MSDAESSQGSSVIKVPLLPLRDIIVFPHMVVPLFVGRDKSIQALKEAMGQDKRIILCAQKRAKTNEPEPEDLFEIGTLGSIRQLIQLPDGTVKVLVLGERRARVLDYLEQETCFWVQAQLLPEHAPMTSALSELLERVRATFDAYVKLNRRIPPELLQQVAKIEPASTLADTIVAQMALKLADKQKLLETIDPAERLERLLELMQEEIEILQVEKKIRSRVKKQMEKGQKDFYLEEGQPAPSQPEQNEFKNEIEELEARIAQVKVSAEAQQKLDRELKKLKMMSPMSAEATVVRNYIDWVIGLPWETSTQDNLDLEAAHQTLERDHYGLKKPKERILEYLAVRALVQQPRGPILCFVGPPGVGKTSLGRSIAQTLGRRFVRLSLGGVRDEAEIRGHRRTYIGAMPGKIIQSMRKAESANPVFLLDEIDKMSTDFRGDPSSALLEVLDPEQNATFNDHYLDMDYDLSQVMFICTANDLRGIPEPLRDRMEIIRLPGYTDPEKLKIARSYLVPKQLEANGLEGVAVELSRGALNRLIEEYTREAGVRSLEREIGAVCRKIASKVVKRRQRLSAQGASPEEIEGALAFEVKAKSIPKLLGPPPFAHTQAEQEDQIGLTHGLAWTQLGGVLLLNEVVVMPGKGRLTITGKLGEVMQESAQAAMSYVRSRALALGLPPDFHQRVDIHVHFPEGALPKDGPSAGITMATSIVSCLLHRPVRRDVAMTGEITLRGRVLPIGGLKEKVLAAHRAGMQVVLIPHENVKDIDEIPASVRQRVTLIPVRHMDEVLLHALVHEDQEAFAAKLKQPSLPPQLLGPHGEDGAPGEPISQEAAELGSSAQEGAQDEALTPISFVSP